ncbi:hypothetical protein RQP46_009868 [Phenoliferia psychrophenolica]
MRTQGDNPVRIGCYRDSVHAAKQLVDTEKDGLDYLVADYLAEVTMGLLARRSRLSKDPARARPGYIDEIIPLVLEDLLPKLVKYNIKLVCNAGGLDPVGLKLAIESFATKKGLSDKVLVAAVFGDDIQETYPTLRDGYGAISPFSPFGDTAGERVESTGGSTKFLSVNAKWDIEKDFDLLASGSLAGHIIECGAQATGGNFTDWREAAFSKNGGWANMGYGIVEVSKDGSFVVTKPAGTGGVVSRLSVGEQMLYEVLDPANYLLPDVILDLTQVTLTQLTPTRVQVSGALGRPPTAWLKCTAIASDGYSILGQLGIIGNDAREKAKVLGPALLERVGAVVAEKGFAPFGETRVEAIGSEEMFGKHAKTSASREVILRIQATHAQPLPLKLLAMELAYSATSTSPAITGGGTGRPGPSPRFSGTSFLLHKSQLPIQVSTGLTEPATLYHSLSHCRPFIAPPPPSSPSPPYIPRLAQPGKSSLVPLVKIAVGRSGDKGDTANVAFLARSEALYEVLKKQVDESVVRDVLGHMIEEGGKVQRYEVPGVWGINFVISKCLGGGGLKSIRFDKQAKSYAQICLSVIQIELQDVVVAKL